MGGTPGNQLTQRPEPRPSGRRGGPALNLALNPARIVPRQEAVDTSNNLYRPTNLMAPCAPVPDAQNGQAPSVTRSWLEAELLLGEGFSCNFRKHRLNYVRPHPRTSNFGGNP